jgi:hypothetical protein
MNDEALKLRGKDGPQWKYVEKDSSFIVFWKKMKDAHPTKRPT